MSLAEMREWQLRKYAQDCKNKEQLAKAIQGRYIELNRVGNQQIYASRWQEPEPDHLYVASISALMKHRRDVLVEMFVLGVDHPCSNVTSLVVELQQKIAKLTRILEGEHMKCD